MPRDSALRFLLVMGVLVALGTVVLVIIGRDDEEGAVPTTTTIAVDPATTCPGADGRSRELRHCLQNSLAFVETPLATGSGVLLPDGHVITNAHVVDPYDQADLTFPGGESFDGVAVIGVDAFADIAVLEPIDTQRPGVEIAPLPDLDAEEEPEVFLVGYPGGLEGDDPAITLASGILSRVRRSEPFDQTYLQTDAAIAGGQSGGALVDSNGRLLGISGLSFADEFALALSSDDVLESIDKVIGGHGDDRRTVPRLEGTASDPVSEQLTSDADGVLAVLPAAPDERSVSLSVTTSGPVVAVDVSTFLGEPLGSNQAGIDAYATFEEEFGGPPFPTDDIPVLDEPNPGSYTFTAPADEEVVVFVSRAGDEPVDVTVDVDVPFVSYDDTIDGQQVTLDMPLQGTVDGFAFEAIHPVELTEGQEIEITVRSPVADSYYFLLAPGEELDPLVEPDPDSDDGGGGLYDLDAHDTHRIDQTGTWRVVVGTWDGIVAGYELTVATT